MRLGVVGAGAWGINHVRVFGAEPHARLAWVCDPDETALDRAARLVPAARLTSRFDDLLADHDLAAVVIATPAATHAELARRALAAGKHVLVEKPLALDVASAERVAAAARAADRVVLVGHLMLYHPAVIQLRDLVRSGELGGLRYLHATRVNLGRLRTDENALWSFGPHDLSMLDFLVGASPIAVAAHGGAYLQPGIEDVVFMTLRYPGGVMGHVHLSWLNPRKERRLTIVGSRKMAELDDMAAEKLRIFDRGYDHPPEFSQYGEYLTVRHGGVHIPAVEMEEPLRVMARHFLACCAGEEHPRSDVASGVRVVQTLAMAQESLRLAGRGLDVADPAGPHRNALNPARPESH